MESSLQVLGIPRDVVEFMRSTNALDDLVAMAEGNFRNMSRFLHPDINKDPGANAFYVRLSDAINDIRDVDGLMLAIERLVSETDKRTNRHRVDAEKERQREKRGFAAVLNLLENVDQFNVLGISGPASFLLQLGASRTILDVSTNDSARLFLTTQEIEVLPEQTEEAKFAEGRWQEMYLADETELWLSHQPEAPTQVVVVGFVPAEALHYRMEDTFEVISEERVELGEGIADPVVIPVWTEPTQAWFLQYLEATPKKHSEVVARNHHGLLAIIGSIQAQAFFYEEQ